MLEKVAVIGASGFVGRHVVRALHDRKIQVVATARDPRRLSEFRDEIAVVALDLAHPAAGAFERLGRPDAVIHLAWEGLPNYHSLHHLETELPRQYAFLSQLVREGLTSLFVAGTCFEYGMQSGPLSEDSVVKPANPYGLAKNQLRHQLQFLQAEQPFRLTWGRLFYTYGDGQNQNSLWSQLHRAVERGDKNFRMSGGEQLRDFLPVSVIAAQIAELVTRTVDVGVINICSGVPRSVRSLVEHWISDNGWRIDLDLGQYPYPDYEPFAFWGERAKLDRILGLK